MLRLSDKPFNIQNTKQRFDRLSNSGILQYDALWKTKIWDEQSLHRLDRYNYSWLTGCCDYLLRNAWVLAQFVGYIFLTY